MKEGTILKWYKGEGDRIEKGEPLVQIMEEKSTIDLETPASGYVRKLYFKEQEDVPVGKILAIIGEKDEPIPTVSEEAEVPEAPVETPSEPQPQKQPVTPPTPTELQAPKGEVKASPLAKKLAREQGIDLSKIKGIGPRGRITASDVKAMTEPGIRKVKETLPLTGMRKLIAERMSLSNKTYSRITLVAEVDASEMIRFRERLKLFENANVSYNDILVKAVARALMKHPTVNSALEGNEIKVFDNTNIGLAVSSPLGLVVPVIHGAEGLPLTEISKRTREVIEKAKSGTLPREDLTGGTFTITNLGMFGVDLFTPIINPLILVST